MGTTVICGPGAAATASGTDSIALPSPTTATYFEPPANDNGDATSDSAKGGKPDHAAAELIYEYVKGPKRGVVRVEASKYRGNAYLNLRLWKPANGGFYPTDTGITLPLDCIADLAAALTHYALLMGVEPAA